MEGYQVTPQKNPRAKFQFSAGWEKEIYKLPGTRNLLQLAVKRVEAYAKGDAPRRKNAGSRTGRRTSWTSIRENIGSAVHMDAGGWFGGVFVEADRRVRHSMLIHEGFKDRAGRRHPGRRYLKGALMKARVTDAD